MGAASPVLQSVDGSGTVVCTVYDIRRRRQFEASHKAAALATLR